MNDEQITALARECINQYPEILDLKTPYIMDYEKRYKEMLHFLLRRFCLVEKDRVKDEYEKAKMDLASKYHQGSMVVLQVLFPELAKAERALDTTITKNGK